jgi:hypothetical protein
MLSRVDDPAVLGKDGGAMLIRAEQMTAFSRAAFAAFEDRMLLHIQRSFPAVFEKLGEVRVCEAIRYGIQRARTYGLTTQRDVCKYIDLMMEFGRDFDTEGTLAGAAEILKDPDFETDTARIEHLYAWAKDSHAVLFSSERGGS